MDRSPGARAIAQGARSFGAGWQPATLAEAPGRLELLGNHVDYNGGLVLAGAIDRVVAVAAGGATRQGRIELVAGDISVQSAHFDVEAARDWHGDAEGIGPVEYATGVVAALLDRGLPVRAGLQLSLAGDIPIGFGMSSSAGLCVALVMTLADTSLDTRDVVFIAREAEHRCGNPVGAMDQSASVAGGVILFDGRTITYEAMEPDLGDYVFAVADSGISHALGESSYATRVQESQEAVTWLRNHAAPGLDSLGDLTPDQWREISGNQQPDGLPPVLRRRVEHAVSEIERVRQGVDAIERSDWPAFGRLMNESGESSDRNYEISHPIVEELVGQLRGLDGVAGARMMGGGEGGPALALIRQEALPHVAEALEHGFFRHRRSHLHGDRLQVCVFGPGAHIETIT